MEHILTMANQFEIKTFPIYPLPTLYMYTGLMLHGAQWHAQDECRRKMWVPGVSAGREGGGHISNFPEYFNGEQRGSGLPRSAAGVGSRGPPQGPWWGPGATPLAGVQGAEPPEAHGF